MKKYIRLFPMLCLCLALLGCLAETPAADSDYPYGNMQTAIPSGNFMPYEGGILFTWNTDGQKLLYRYDPKEGRISLLCKDAACGHKSCVSGQVTGALELCNGKLYARTSGNQLSSLEGARFEPVISGEIVHFCHGGGDLYVETADRSLLVYKNGSGTPRVLLEEYTELWNTVFGQYLYSGFGQGICRVDISVKDPQLEILVEGSFGITDGQHLYYPDPKDDTLHRCAMDGTGGERLTTAPIYPGSLNFDQDYLYFRLYQAETDLFGEAGRTLYRMSKDDPQHIEPIAFLPEAISAIYTIPGQDLLFVVTCSLGEPEKDGNGVTVHPNAQDNLYVMNADGSGMTHLEFPPT